MSASEAAALIGDTDSIAIPLGPGQPADFLHALGERPRFTGLRVFGALLMDAFALFTRPGVTLLSGFHGPVERALAKSGCDVQFVPADFRRFAHIARRLAPRVVATNAAPADASGRMSLSLHAGATVDEILRCARDPDRILIVEQNPRLPRTLGLPPEHPHSIAVDEIDILIEGQREPLMLPDTEPSDIERAIAGHVRTFVPDGATLQTGIGGIPNAVVRLLAEGPGGDYGIHSEMFTDALMRLHRAGKVTNRKGQYDGMSICTFAAGTAALYQWLDGNQDVRFLPVEQVNQPGIIARNRAMISINGALAVDAAGQVAADTLPGMQFSGIGGHEDFVAGASFSAGGRSLLCLPSTAMVGDTRVSRIVAQFAPGTLVTTPRHQVDVVITEYGAAELAGLTVAERARALAAIAHPHFRDAIAPA